MLDIEKLRLTADEQYPYMSKIVSKLTQDHTLDGRDIQDMLDAQLAKALWGLAEWLDEMGGETCVQGAVDLLNIFEAAGIPCPEGINVSGKWL